MTQEALKLALEWAEANGEIVFAGGGMDAVNKMNSWATAIKEALAQTQEPVACAECERLKDALKRANGLAEHFERAWYLRGDEIEELQAPPPQRTWVDLTDEELADCMDMSIQKTCRAIEAKLKEKNT